LHDVRGAMREDCGTEDVMQFELTAIFKEAPEGGYVEAG
jgi:hypothetical protein